MTVEEFVIHLPDEHLEQLRQAIVSEQGRRASAELSKFSLMMHRRMPPPTQTASVRDEV